MKRFLLYSWIIASLALIPFAFYPHSVYAAKKLVRKTKVQTKYTGISFSSAKLSRTTNSIILSLYNLNKASKVRYFLSYSANGINQGVVGAITPSSTTDSRDLYFGTCSKGVCTPHYTIKNAVLTVTTTISSGGTNAKRYRIKI